MWQPFIWMFQIKKFRSTFYKIILKCLLMLTLTPIICYALFPALKAGQVRLIIYTILSLPLLYILGYFWSLTENIIDRESDVRASNIFINDIKTIYLITLPDLKTLQYIWRGIASIFACILMAIPYIGLYKLSLIPENIQLFSGIARAIISIFFLSFVPILLWNYARRNSVTAVWNLSKAIYILGNYPLRYFSRILGVTLICYINFYLDNIILNNTSVLYFNIAPEHILASTFVYFLLLVKFLYFLFVIAYLIGTLAPEYEP